MSIKDKYAIVGLGVTKQGKLPGVTANGIRAEASRLAISDAGLEVSDLDGFIYQRLEFEGAWGSGPPMRAGGTVPQMLGMRPRFVWQMQSGGGSAVAAVTAAIGAIECGMAKRVLVCYGGAPISAGLTIGAGKGGFSTPGAFGMLSPAGDHAFAARRHMHEFGTTKEHLGSIAVAQREYAQMRPDAMMHDRPLTMDAYLKSRYVAEPLSFFDSCLVNDGGIAFVVATSEDASTLKSKPVYIMGVGTGHQMRRVHEKDQYTTLDIAPSKEAAFKTAGISIEDVDVVEFYDCFTITVLLQAEGYGLCKKGEGGPFFAEGNSKLGGKYPVNTAGGSLSWGYAQGFTPIAEAVRQLRGQGGATQVKDAEIALCSGHGGTNAGSLEYCHGTLVLRR